MDDDKDKMSIAELNRLYSESEQADQEIFSEQRTNLLLVAGEHYNKRGSRFWSRIRDSRQLTQEQKIRLTKNHIGKISQLWVNSLINLAPDVGVEPKHEKELADQKTAELCQAVWQWLKDKHKWREKRLEWAEDFFNAGEVVVKVFWDPSLGPMKGYNATVDEATGEFLVDEQGAYVPDMSQPVMSGGLVWERIDAFNLLRAPEAKSMDESRFFIYRKMVDIDHLKAMVGNDEEKLKLIQAASKDVFTVFDGASGSYNKAKNQCLVKEYYFRSCPDYPEGWYVIATEQGKLFEGPLPFGIFPIRYKGFSRVPTTPRARSLIKQLRPYQIEINRSASKIAEHQITLGDDKLILSSGTKMSPGGSLPGVRGITVQGMPPTVLPGRNGSQYLEYMNSQVEEMYKIANVSEMMAEKETGQIEPYTLLFKSAQNKLKFSTYAEKFEDFLVDICEVSLEMMQRYCTPEMLIPAIGKREFINVDEFKGAEKISYKVKLSPQTEDLETKMGKQIAMTHVLQYVGAQLGKDDIGKIIRCMPYCNNEEMFNDLTMDYDNVVSDMLAMDRGQMRPPRPYDNHPYIIQKLGNRMGQSDFDLLPPPVQQMYQQKMDMHQQSEVQKQQAIQAAQAGYIPSGGYLVACDFYVDDPADPARTRRARVPYESLKWLLDRLEQQGMGLQDMENMQQSVLGELSQKMVSQHPAPGGQPAPAPQGAQAMQPPPPIAGHHPMPGGR